MSKDPACLFYINDWLTSTAELDADCRGWYLNLILHNYDKGDLPNDLEKLAVLCNVKFSEYKRFEQVFEHVLKQKFEQVGEHRLSNLRTQSVLKAREQFKEKRSNAGKTSYLMRFFYEKFKKESKDKKLLVFVKNNLNTEIDTKNEQVIEHMFEHLFELFKNENENKDEIVDENKGGQKQKNEQIKYGQFENVVLSDEEYTKAAEKYKEDLIPMIEKLSSYIQSSGKKYKSHYATFSSWVYQSIIEEKHKNKNQNGRENSKDYLKRVGGELDDIFKRKEQTGNYFGLDLTREG